jgi:hypothetical protein
MNIQLGEFIVMPNHIHGIIIIDDNGDLGAGFKPALDNNANNNANNNNDNNNNDNDNG